MSNLTASNLSSITHFLSTCLNYFVIHLKKQSLRVSRVYMGNVCKRNSWISPVTLLDRPAFVAFVTAGFPSPDETVDILLGLEKGGADVIELGKVSESLLSDVTSRCLISRYRHPFHRSSRRWPYYSICQYRKFRELKQDLKGIPVTDYIFRLL